MSERASLRNRCKALASDLMLHTGILKGINAAARHFEIRRDRGRRSIAPVTRRKYLILCYHRVGTGGIPYYSGLPQYQFEAQVQFLKANYRILSMTELCQELCERPSSPARPAVILTFDDGYVGTYENAFPVLKKYGIPAMVYLTGQCIETGEVAWYDKIFALAKRYSSEVVRFFNERLNTSLANKDDFVWVAFQIVKHLRTIPNGERVQFCQELASRFPVSPSETRDRMLTWNQVRAMQDDGISFGVHTMTHPAVSRLNDLELQSEILGCKRLIEERLQLQMLDFAYPFGLPADCGLNATPHLEKWGFRTAVTTVPALVEYNTDALLMPRVGFVEGRKLSTFGFDLVRLLLDRVTEGSIRSVVADMQEMTHDPEVSRA